MAKKSSNVTKLAKTGSKKSTSQKNESVDDTIDVGAKKRVEELLSDVDISPSKREELLELDEESMDRENQLAWMEDELSKLSKENEELRKAATAAKDDYKKIFEENQKLKKSNPDSRMQAAIVGLFNELQENHFKRGKKFHIHPVPFMVKLTKMFPFLSDHRRF